MEADWDTAPSLLDGAMKVELTAAQCGVRYWFDAVPNGTLRGQSLGHSVDVRTPDILREPGPLRDALSQELAFRSMAEEKATRAISYLVASAPDNETMEFFATQLLDEARHAMVFRNHLLDLGVEVGELWETVEKLAGADRDRILLPLEEFGLKVLRDDGDFIGGVVVLTVLVEGVLAPSAELSERKWRPLDPAAADIERGAGIDEIRHLTVGGSVAREHLLRHPEDKPRILQLIGRGVALWDKLPVTEQIYGREVLFQQGLEQHAQLVGDYEIWPGKRLIDTTPQERMQTAMDWSRQMQAARLTFMGLPEVLG
jgi:hypothetical protein